MSDPVYIGYYTLDNALSMPNDARFLMYDPAGPGSYNITGALLKSQILASPVITGQMTVPDLKAIQVTSPSRASIRHSLLLDFANSRIVDPRITYARASTSTYFDEFGVSQTAAVNQPRITFDSATGVCKGLLLEESRTNLLTYSEQFDNASWVKINTNVSANTAVAPDGAVTANLLTENTATGEHYIDKTISATSGTSYTLSFFVKQSIGSRKLGVRVHTSAVAVVTFDLSTGEGTGLNVTNLVSYGSKEVSNGWWRCWIVVTAASTGTLGCRAQMYNGSANIYTGDGASGFYVWGAQLEVGALPTSYIPTTSAAVTRATDLAGLLSTSFSSWYNQSEGTIVVELEWPTVSSISTAAGFSVSDGTANNRIILSRAGTGNTPQMVVSVAGVNQTGVYAGTVTAGTLFKLAFSYKENSFLFALNGSQTSASIDLSGSLPIVDRFYFGNETGTTVSKYIKRFVYYPKQFTSEQLKGLTSL